VERRGANGATQEERHAEFQAMPGDAALARRDDAGRRLLYALAACQRASGRADRGATGREESPHAAVAAGTRSGLWRPRFLSGAARKLLRIQRQAPVMGAIRSGGITQD